MKTPQLTARMIEALLVAADGRNTSNMHATYKALRDRGLVEYVWGVADCWVITAAGETVASELRASAA